MPFGEFDSHHATLATAAASDEPRRPSGGGPRAKARTSRSALSCREKAGRGKNGKSGETMNVAPSADLFAANSLARSPAERHASVPRETPRLRSSVLSA